MTIEQRPCPRCAIRRIVRMGTWGWFCFNCRLRLAAVRASARTGTADEQAEQHFTPAERVRLEQYRAAVRAGLYSDWPRLMTQR